MTSGTLGGYPVRDNNGQPIAGGVAFLEHQMETRPCEQCGKPVTRFPCKFKRFKHVYCSQECCNEWRKNRPRPDHGPKVSKALKGRKPSPQCIEASINSEKRKQTWASEEYRRNMSESVRKVWKDRPGPMTGRNGKSNPNWRGGRFVICFKCGKQVWKCPTQLKSEHHFCSVKCTGNQPSERSINSRRKKGLSPYASYWVTIASEARERDDHQCQTCGTRYKKYKLPVHHIKPISLFDDPLDAHYLNNLITLCRKCHARVEIGTLTLPQEIIERSEHIDKHQS